MSEKSILDQIMPLEEDGEANLLAGLQDFTYGAATEFFDGLSPEDREIAQWYLTQNISPLEAHGYAERLVSGYAVVDPNRLASDGMEAAHTELARIRRYVGIFLESEDFFPIIDTFSVTVRDEAGELEGRISVPGWSRLGAPSDAAVFSLKWHQDTLTNESPIMEYLEQADAFIDDPMAVPEVFDQAAMFSELQEKYG